MDPIQTLTDALKAMADPDSGAQYGSDRYRPAAALLRELADWLDRSGFSPVTAVEVIDSATSARGTTLQLTLKAW